MQLIQYLTFNEANKALDFYEKLGATNIQRVKIDENAARGMHLDYKMVEGKLMHAYFEMLGMPLYASDYFGKTSATPNSSLCFVFDKDDIDAVKKVEQLFEKAESLGCEMIMPISETFWSPMYGMFKDPFDVKWMISAE